MTPWRFKLWRFGWARAYFAVIGGWRQLVWRLWWDLRIPDPQPKIRILPSLKPPAILHWPSRPWLRAQQLGNHWCDAPPTEPWCEKFDEVTCPKCRALGEPYYIQYKTNTR